MVSEIGQSLNPHVTSCRRISIGCLSVLCANFHNFIFFVLLDVVVQELLLEPESIAALFNTVRKIVNLEQEQNIVFVYFLVVPSYKVNDLILEFCCLWLVVRTSFDLSTVKHVLQKSMVQVDCGQLIELS